MKLSNVKLSNPSLLCDTITEQRWIAVLHVHVEIFGTGFTENNAARKIFQN